MVARTSGSCRLMSFWQTWENHQLLITNLGEHQILVLVLPRYSLALVKASLGSQGAGRQTCIFFSFQDS